MRLIVERQVYRENLRDNQPRTLRAKKSHKLCDKMQSTPCGIEMPSRRLA